MGSFLGRPKTKCRKDNGTRKDGRVRFGASHMQGWRVSDEDAHRGCPDYDGEYSFFGVFDGHGGHEVSTFCANNLHEHLRKRRGAFERDLNGALVATFLETDASILTEGGRAQLRTIIKARRERDDATYWSPWCFEHCFHMVLGSFSTD